MPYLQLWLWHGICSAMWRAVNWNSLWALQSINALLAAMPVRRNMFNNMTNSNTTRNINELKLNIRCTSCSQTPTRTKTSEWRARRGASDWFSNITAPNRVARNRETGECYPRTRCCNLVLTSSGCALFFSLGEWMCEYGDIYCDFFMDVQLVNRTNHNISQKWYCVVRRGTRRFVERR